MVDDIQVSFMFVSDANMAEKLINPKFFYLFRSHILAIGVSMI